MHCDQHLHKMMLESAQMLSTAFSKQGIISDWLYKSAYEKHPCTIWTTENMHNAFWLCELATELEVIRQELNHPYHASSDCIKFCRDYILDCEDNISIPTDFPFAGPAHLSLNKTIPVWEKYRRFTRLRPRSGLTRGGQ